MLTYEVHGSGAPLVLVHGLTHRRQAWYPVLEHLTDHREVILVDLPGHGESPDLVVRNGDVESSLRGDLLAMLDALGLERPHMAGNSMGGRIALEAAADGLVASATALSPAAFWFGRADFAYVRAVFAAIAGGAKLAAPLLPWVAASALGRTVLGGVVAAHPSRMSPTSMVDDARAMRRALPAMRAIFPVARPFDRPIPEGVPVTIGWGARDLILLPYQARLAQRQLPDARHFRLRGCGHVPMSDDPVQVAGVLLAGSGCAVEREDVA